MTEQWITEQLHPYYRKSLRVLNTLVDEQTEFQHIQILETEFFGKVMVLDGIIQLTERDNAGYHEMITHIPLLAQGNPRRVLIVGGGDGGSLRHQYQLRTITCRDASASARCPESSRMSVRIRTYSSPV